MQHLIVNYQIFTSMICKIDHKKLKESNFKKHGIKILSFLKKHIQNIIWWKQISHSNLMRKNKIKNYEKTRNKIRKAISLDYKENYYYNSDTFKIKLSFPLTFI